MFYFVIRFLFFLPGFAFFMVLYLITMIFFPLDASFALAEQIECFFLTVKHQDVTWIYGRICLGGAQIAAIIPVDAKDRDTLIE